MAEVGHDEDEGHRPGSVLDGSPSGRKAALFRREHDYDLSYCGTIPRQSLASIACRGFPQVEEVVIAGCRDLNVSLIGRSGDSRTYIRYRATTVVQRYSYRTSDLQSFQILEHSQQQGVVLSFTAARQIDLQNALKIVLLAFSRSHSVLSVSLTD